MTQKVRCVVDAYSFVTENKQAESANAWRRCGLPDGVPHFASIRFNRNDNESEEKAMKPLDFAAGTHFRDKSLPPITPDYLAVLFSVENLAGGARDGCLSETATRKLADLKKGREEEKKCAVMILETIFAQQDSSQSSDGRYMSIFRSKASTIYSSQVHTSLRRSLGLLSAASESAAASSASSSSPPTPTKLEKKIFSQMQSDGLVLTNLQMITMIKEAEASAEQKTRATEARNELVSVQKSIWEQLKARLILETALEITSETKTSPKTGAISTDVLKRVLCACKLSYSGRQVDQGNRLLRHFNLIGDLHEIPKEVEVSASSQLGAFELDEEEEEN